MNAPRTSAVPRELVLASAGSGKTYHISSRIIRLLAEGTPASAVLASTFTRKAAGEILERVLVRLAEGASDPEKARELGQDAHECLAEPEECRRLLARVLADLHQLNVGTLDAFFVRVARSFFQELGLAPGWTIADPPAEERLRTEAVHAALAGADRSELLDLLRRLNRGEANRQVHDALLAQVDTLVLIRRQLDPAAVDPWSPDLAVSAPLDREELRARASDLAAHLRGLGVPTTKGGDPMKNWLAARDRASHAIGSLDWEAAFGRGVGLKVIEGGESFSGRPIESDFKDVFLAARTLARIDLAPQIRREAEAMGRLAELLESSFERAQRRVGAYRFEDLTYLLGGADATARRDDLHYRLDQQVRYLLLDEFQDTSLEQWRALEPLAHELLSGRLDDRGEIDNRAGVDDRAAVDDRGGVVVADTKQSIYGWRGARPELVRQVGERHSLVETTLDKSWRSSSVVLDLVADVFRDLPQNPVVSSIDVGPSAASAWMEDFTELEAARDLPGHVCVHLAEDDGGTAEIRPNLLRHAAKVVKALHDQMPNQTIGVLARRNGVVGYLMDELRALGLRASGEGGTSLTDTAPVNAVLSFLQLADHPSDRLARYHVATTPLGEVVGLSDSEHTGAARSIASRTRIQLLTGGYGPTLAKWVHELAPLCDPREVGRLLQLVELGHRWDGRPTLRPTDFVRYVAGESVEDPSSARVQVMTVHRSKGLEFDAVVLPELYASLAPSGRCVPIPERNREGLVVRVYPCIEKHVRALFPEVEGPEREAQAAELRDEFSVLYVALTRARYALHLILPPEGGSSKHGAGLIREALELADEPARGEGVLLERGDPRWFERLEGEVETRPQVNTEAEPEKEADPTAPLLRSSTAGPGRNLARRSPASLEGGARVDLSLALRLDTASALRRGDVVHAWCEGIEWIEDGIGDDDELAEIARKRAPGMHRDRVDALITAFRGWLQAEPIRGALSREALGSGPDTVVRVENELPFVRRVADEIQEGFIDRLVLIERGGQLVRAEILDFKTDAIEAGDEATLIARTEHYRPQITAYHDVVQQQYGLAEGAVTGKLVFLGAGVVRQVTGA